MDSDIPESVLLEQFQLTDIYLDLHDYRNMTQEELSEKIAKWDRIFSNFRNDNIPLVLRHLRKYCRRCDERLFHVSGIYPDPNNNGRRRRFHWYGTEFYLSYRNQLRRLRTLARDHYRATETANADALAVRIAEFQNTHKNATDC
jgi:hypothetical protein